MLVDYLGRGDWRAAARRWALVREQHERTKLLVARGESPDTTPRQLAAARRALDLAPTVAAETGAAKAIGLADWLGTRGKERLIGRSDFEPGAFLEVGLAVGRAVCMVELKDRLGGTVLRGTGFLVAPGVIVTNHHVLMSEDEARNATVTFDYRNDPYGRPTPTTVFSLDPSLSFETSAEYDCTFVRVGTRISGAFQIADFGWLPLVGAEGKVEVGDPINIIQHPSGEPMQWVVRDNRLLTLPELAGQRDPKIFAHYEADTMPGSSGAPAMSRLWEVFALHHQAVPAIDAAGNPLDVDGRPYFGSDDTRVKWLGNEGVRVSALVRLLQERRSNARPEHARGLDQILEAVRPDYVALAAAAHGHPSTSDRESTQGGAMTGRLEFTLPLRISISLGDPSAGNAAAAASATIGAAPSSSSTASRVAASPAALSPSMRQQKQEALEELERSRTRTYLDRAAIAAANAAYYQNVVLGADEAENFTILAERLASTHTARPRYAPSRQLYPWIDLHKDGRRLSIKSIYSGKVFDAREFIEEAFAIEARREALRASLRSNEAFGGASEAVIDQLLEDTAPYNCEHTVPQSWFQKKEPMRGDLHHLFACESRCNSFRGNHAYFEFPDREATMEACGEREEDRFEPVSGKGAVARATLYYLLRYPATIDIGISQMTADRVNMLKQWHVGDPVGDYEQHRNQAIFEVQGNRNPFIDHPDWVNRVAIAKGLG